MGKNNMKGLNLKKNEQKMSFREMVINRIATRNHLANDDGFSLIEMVVSVGIVLVLSVGGVAITSGINQATQRSAVVNSTAQSLYNDSIAALSDFDDATTVESTIKDYEARNDELIYRAGGFGNWGTDATKDNLCVSVSWANTMYDESAQVGICTEPDGDENTANNNGDGVAPIARPIVTAEPTPEPTKPTESTPTPTPTPETKPNATTVAKFKCDVDTTGTLGFQSINSKTTMKIISTKGTTNYTADKMTGNVTFAKGIEYTVTVDGLFGSYVGADPTTVTKSPTLCITSWDQFGVESGVKTLSFIGGPKLTNVPSSIPTSVTSLSNVLNGSTIFNDKDVNTWNVSNVTSLSKAFYNNKAFNQSLSSWNVGKVTVFSNIFAGAAAFNQNINSWNVSAGIKFDGVFNGASNYNQPLSSWNMSNATDIGWFFQGAVKFNQNISSWNTANVTRARNMFNGATVFNNNNVSLATSGNAWNLAKVTDFGYMFQNAKAFNQNVNNWNTALSTSFYQMFNGATKFNQNISKWNTAKATNMSGMIRDSAMNQNLSQWNVAIVTSHTNFALNAPMAKTTAYLPKFK